MLETETSGHHFVTPLSAAYSRLQVLSLPACSSTPLPSVFALESRVLSPLLMPQVLSERPHFNTLIIREA
jgi:hypothetical protein